MICNSKYAEDFICHGKLTCCSIIDCHAHMGLVYGVSIPNGDAVGMLQVMDRENIEAVFCSPHSALFDPGAGNSEIESVMRKYPGRFYGYYTYNPNYPDKYLAHLDDVLRIKGYIGFKILPHYHGYALDGEAYQELLKFADRNSLVVLCHTWGGSPLNGPEQVQAILRKYTNLIFIMGHSAPGECDKAIETARKYANVYLDLCDIHRHSGIVDKFVQSVGADRVLFGTDIPWYDPNYCLGSILFSRISDLDKYKIIYGNGKILINRSEGKS